MARSMDGLLLQLKGFWGGLTAVRKLTMVVVTLVVFAGFGVIMAIGGRPSYRVLFTNLSPEDAAAVVESLKERKIPYRLGKGGGAIEVPEEMLHEVRLALATDGLPQSGGVGFELFDRNSFGATDFVQRVNLQRALQGELARSIRHFPQVTQARVHLTIPEKSLFVREAQRPQASVVLQLKPGAVLQPSQLQGIVHLVASSVQGLQPHDVHVVDTSGKVLYSPRDGADVEGGLSRMAELQTELERRLEAKVQTILEPILGPRKVVARVHADLDPRRVEQTEEQYDPDRSAVRSEQRSSERSSYGGTGEQGVPGVMSNLGDQRAGSIVGVSGPNLQRENETVNYELNRLTRRIVAPVGEIRRLTVAVLVDGVKKKVAGNDGQETWVVEPRPAEEIKSYEEIVKQAVGFNPQRGDQLQVASVPFERMEEPEEHLSQGLHQALSRWAEGPLVRHGSLLLLALLFSALVLRPLVKGMIKVIQASPSPMQLSSGPHGLEPSAGHVLPSPGAGATEGASQAAVLPVEVVKLAEESPQRLAAALKTWMRQGG